MTRLTVNKYQMSSKTYSLHYTQ